MPVPAEDAEASHLKLEINALRRELEFQTLNMSVLNRLNANARAWLRSQEIYYLVLTGVTADTGLGLNRAMLFVTEPATMEMHGAMAISPDSMKHMHEIYETAADRKFSFEYYVEQFYRGNLQVRNKLHKFVTNVKFSRNAPNILNEVLERKKARYVRAPLEKDFRGLPGLRKRLKGEFVVAPLCTAHEEIGVLLADNFFTRKSLSPQDAVALQNTCKFAATMIAGAREFERSDFHTQGDPLTQVFNFRYIRQILTHEIARCDRYSRKTTVALVEIDRFPDYAETHGHLAGNKALMDVAALAKSHSRCVDYVGRQSGARFIILYPETNRKGAEKALGKLEKIVAETKFVGAVGRGRRRLTVTTAAACYPDDAPDAASLLDRVERTLTENLRQNSSAAG